MFCSNCAGKMKANAEFCGNCGTKNKSSAPASSAGIQKKSSSSVVSENVGSSIISGKGTHKMKSIIGNIVFWVGDVILTFILIAQIDNAIASLPRNARTQLDRLNNMAIILIVLMALFSFWSMYAIWKSYNAYKSNISVCESGIKGSFITGALGSRKEVTLSYDMIINVDVINNTKMIIHAQHEKYTCHALNSNEIRDSIMEHVNATKTK